MNDKIKKIGILTGGGDCPGLNAVIRAVTKAAIANYGYEVIGYKFGYRGLYNNDFIKLDAHSVSGILHKGGTILYSSNKDNLFDYQVEENGQCVKKDVSDVAVANMKKEGVDVLVVLGFMSFFQIEFDLAALAGVLALGIALLTVSWQSWKAATRNPVEALRYE